MFSPNKIKTLNDVEKQIYYFTINNEQLIPYMTIREFATEVHSSPPSILRYCRKLGFNGFKQYKQYCKEQIEKSEKLDTSFDIGIMFKEFLVKVDTPIYQEKIYQAVDILTNAQRIFCVGDGASGSIAYYAAMYFTVSGKLATFIDGKLLKAIHQPSPDVYILFCVSGESENMITFINSIKENNGMSIVITNSEYSTLSKLGDFALPYNIYYSQSKKQRVDTYESNLTYQNSIDDLSTQLPVVYLIEILASMINKL
ncbi:MAG: MurR/RpiR family transcriptional regulator [Eubacteriaceae bacterium]